jgi:predicted nucleic acid-binding protein
VSDPATRWTIDANVILRYVLADHAQLTARARTLWHALDEGRIRLACDPVTLAEVVWVLSSAHQYPRERISAALIKVFSLEGVEMLGKERYLHALELFAGPVPHFGDACACALALEETEGRLFSFDRKLSSVPGITRAEKVDA